MVLFTIGYEGHTPESFIDLLCDNQVEVLTDVRQRAGSRKPKFSKTGLSELLAEHGIMYRHFPLLGTPPDMRARYKAGELDRGRYLAAYREHLASQLDQLAELTQLIGQHRCCLMCVEHEPEECHRSILARELANRIDNLEVRDV